MVLNKDEDSEKYCSHLVKAFPTEENNELFFNVVKGKAMKLPAEISFILKHMRYFRSIKEHAEYIHENIWNHYPVNQLIVYCNQLVKKGCLYSKSELINDLTNLKPEKSNNQKISNICWITIGRKNELHRSIQSAVKHNNKYERKMSIAVVNESSLPDIKEYISSMLKNISSEEGLDFLYIDREYKEKYCRKLLEVCSSEGLPEKVLRFALFDDENIGNDFGVSWNMLLLATRGKRIMCMDDDGIYQYGSIYKDKALLELSSAHDPTDLHYYKDKEDLLNEVKVSDICIPECHEKILGKSIGECIDQLNNPDALICNHIVNDYLSSLRKEPVLVGATIAGVYGDCGFGSPAGFLCIDEKQEDYLFSSENTYLSALKSRQVYKSVPNYTISSNSYFMSGNMALDNYLLLPPFFPVTRGSDSIFGALVRICCRNIWIGHIPYGFYHDPEEKRSFKKESKHEINLAFSHILLLILQSYPGYRLDTETSEKYSAVGSYLKEIASMSNKNFEEYITSLWLPQVSRYILRLENCLLYNDYKPDFWVQDVEDHIKNIYKYFEKGTVSVPRDINIYLSNDERRTLCKKLIRSFGELLIFWPLIMQKSLELV